MIILENTSIACSSKLKMHHVSQPSKPNTQTPLSFKLALNRCSLGLTLPAFLHLHLVPLSHGGGGIGVDAAGGGGAAGHPGGGLR